MSLDQNTNFSLLRCRSVAGDLVYFTAVGLALLALATAVGARRSIADAWRPGQRLPAAAAQVLVTGSMLTEVTWVSNRTATQMAVILAFVSLLLYAELTDTRLRRHPFRTLRVRFAYNETPIASILALWIWFFGVNLWCTLGEPSNQPLFRVGSGVALVLFLITQRYRPVRLLHFYSAALTTVVAIVATIPLSADSFSSCSDFKCNVIGALLHGPFPSENSLGFAAATCAVLYLLAVPKSRRTALVPVFLCATVYASYSRTSLTGLGAVIALAAVHRLLIPAPSRRRPRLLAHLVAAGCSVIPLVIGMVLVYNADRGAFSQRGRIWALGRTAASESPLAGRGLDSWSALAHSGYFGRGFELYPHSEYLLIYFSGGAVGLFLFSLAIYRITFVAIKAQNSVTRGAMLPLFFVTAAITESVWNPLSVDLGTWTFFALVATCAPNLRERLAKSPSPRAATRRRRRRPAVRPASGTSVTKRREALGRAGR